MNGEELKQRIVTKLLSVMTSKGITPKMLAKELKTTQARIDALLSVSDYNLDLRLFVRTCQYLNIQVRLRTKAETPKNSPSFGEVKEFTTMATNVASASFLKRPSPVQH